MNKINIWDNVKNLSNQIAINSTKEEVDYFPIDRFFIEKKGYLDKILSVNYLEFLLCNFENVNPTYTVQLFVCLPELWEKVTHRDIISLIENFTNSFSFYSLIEYTYKYLRIDIFDEIFLNDNIDVIYKQDCIRFSLNTIASLYLDENDYQEFEENLLGINLAQIKNIQDKFKNDDKFKKAIPEKELHEKLSNIENTLRV